MKDRKLEVYRITNLINNKVYVGITNQGVKTRWYKHCSDSFRGSEFPLHNALRKYGIDNFKIEVIEVCDTIDQLKEREGYWIKELDSRTTNGNGYNLTDGGDGTFGRKHSDSTKDKIRQKALDRSQDESYIEMVRLTRAGNKEISQYNIDGTFIKTYRSLSEASRQLDISKSSISACATGKVKTSNGFIWSYTGNIPVKPAPIIKEKVKKVNSEESRKKSSISNKLRWEQQPERRIKQSINNYKNRPILQYTLDGEFVKEYYNVSDAVRAVGATTHTNIAKCARGIRKKACDYIWKYKDNINS